MDHTEMINEVVDTLLKYMRTLPAGTVTTTAQLIQIYNDPRDLRKDLLQIHYTLIQKAKDEHIRIMPLNDDEAIVGLPYNLPFEVFPDSFQ